MGLYSWWPWISSQPESRASINLGEGAWVSLVVFQPWSHPAFLWCVGVNSKHMDGVVSDKDLEVPVVFAQQS